MEKARRDAQHEVDIVTRQMELQMAQVQSECAEQIAACADAADLKTTSVTVDADYRITQVPPFPPPIMFDLFLWFLLVPLCSVVKHPFQEVGAKRGATRERCLTTLRGRLRSARCAHVGWVVAQTTRDCERKMEAVRLAHRKDVDDLETKLQLMRDQHLADLAEAEAEVRPLTLDRRWLAGPHPASPVVVNSRENQRLEVK